MVSLSKQVCCCYIGLAVPKQGESLSENVYCLMKLSNSWMDSQCVHPRVSWIKLSAHCNMCVLWFVCVVSCALSPVEVDGTVDSGFILIFFHNSIVVQQIEISQVSWIEENRTFIYNYIVSFLSGSSGLLILTPACTEAWPSQCVFLVGDLKPLKSLLAGLCLCMPPSLYGLSFRWPSSVSN